MEFSEHASRHRYINTTQFKPNMRHSNLPLTQFDNPPITILAFTYFTGVFMNKEKVISEDVAKS